MLVILLRCDKFKSNARETCFYSPLAEVGVFSTEINFSLQFYKIIIDIMEKYLYLSSQCIII